MKEPNKIPLDPSTPKTKEVNKYPLNKLYPQSMEDDVYIRPDKNSVYTPINNPLETKVESDNENNQDSD